MGELLAIFATFAAVVFGMVVFLSAIVVCVHGVFTVLRQHQRVAVLLGLLLMAADVYYPPYIRVVATAPLIDIDPPSIPRYPRERAIGRWWWSAIDNDPSTRRDLTRLFAEMSAIAVATVAVIWLLRPPTPGAVSPHENKP